MIRAGGCIMRRGTSAAAIMTMQLLHSVSVYGALLPHMHARAHARYGAALAHTSYSPSRLRGEALLVAKTQDVGVEPDLVDMVRRGVRSAVAGSSGFFQAAMSGGDIPEQVPDSIFRALLPSRATANAASLTVRLSAFFASSMI